MKTSINLLIPKEKDKVFEEKKKKVLKICVVSVSLFLIFNLLLFAYYFWLNKNTADTLTATTQTENRLKNLLPTEIVYRKVLAKLNYLSKIWSVRDKIAEGLDFSQKLIGPEVNIKNLSLKDDGMTQLSLITDNPENMEIFLNKLLEKESKEQIKEATISGVKKNEDTEYKYSFNAGFLFLKK